MKGKANFTAKEAESIKEHLREVRKVGRDAQKQIRAHMRSSIKFYISDFTNSTEGFTEADFVNLVNQGKIKIN